MEYEIKLCREIDGVKHYQIVFDIGTASGMDIRMPGCELDVVILRGKSGYLICGIADLAVCEILGDAAGIVKTTSVKEMLCSPVYKRTEHAAVLGVQEGMQGAQALRLML